MELWRDRLRELLRMAYANERVMVIMITTALMMCGHGCVTPVLPLLATSLGASMAEVGLSLTAFALARLILNVPLSVAADRFGRKPFLVGGPLVSMVGMLGSGLSENIPELLAWRAVAGAGNAAYLGAAQLYLQDISTEATRARVLGANHSALLFGVGLGPALGGVVAIYCGLQAPFFLVGALAGAAGLYGSQRLPETLVLATAVDVPRSVSEPSWALTVWSFWTDRRFRAVGLANAGSFAMRQGGCYTLYALLAVDKYGYDAGLLGQTFAGMVLANLLLVMPSAFLSDYVSDRRYVIVPGILCSASGLVALSLADTHSTFVMCTVLWALATASQGSSLQALAADVTPPQHRGLGISLFRSAGDVGFLVAPVVFGALADAYSVEFAMQVLAASYAGVSVSLLRSGGVPRQA